MLFIFLKGVVRSFLSLFSSIFFIKAFSLISDFISFSEALFSGLLSKDKLISSVLCSLYVAMLFSDVSDSSITGITAFLLITFCILSSLLFPDKFVCSDAAASVSE